MLFVSFLACYLSTLPIMLSKNSPNTVHEKKKDFPFIVKQCKFQILHSVTWKGSPHHTIFGSKILQYFFWKVLHVFSKNTDHKSVFSRKSDALFSCWRLFLWAEYVSDYSIKAKFFIVHLIYLLSQFDVMLYYQNKMKQSMGIVIWHRFICFSCYL
jgi:hypothetical protein